MSFAETFLPFVCEGDTITCAVDGFDVIARIVCDECSGPPDQRQDGFWPSLEIGKAGFIGAGPNHRQRFAEAQARAEAVMQSWRLGDWFYCGLVLSVSLEGVEIAPHAASVWSIKTNDPGTDNSDLSQLASDLLPDALAAARETLARLMAYVEAVEVRG